MAFCPGTPKEESRNCPVWTPGTLQDHSSFLRPLIGWSLKKTCSSPRELCNSVLYSTCMHQGWVDSRLLVVGNQTTNLTPDLSFCHNMCCKCPDGPCEPVFDIYTLIAFQWYKEHHNARCFDLCNWTVKFQESQRIPKSPFWECEFHPHTLSK